MADVAPKNGGSTTADEETNCGRRGKEGGPSLNSLALLRKAIPWTSISSDDIEGWRRAVYEGVLLENNTQWIYQKFWVDAKLHKNCFLVLPKACDIAGSDEESCWRWITMEEKCFPMAVDILVPESKEIFWLLIQGRFKTRVLSPNTTYEIAFVVKLNRTDVSDPSEVELELRMPDGTKQTRTERLIPKLVGEGRELRAGEFMMGPETVGTIHFTLQGTLDPRKEGLILKGIRINPKN